MVLWLQPLPQGHVMCHHAVRSRPLTHPLSHPHHNLAHSLKFTNLRARNRPHPTHLPTTPTATNARRQSTALGMIVAPIVAGMAIRRDPRLSFAVATAWSLLGAALSATFFVETLSPADRAAAIAMQDSEGGVFAPDRCLNPLTSLELFKRSSKLKWLTISCTLSMASDYNTDLLPLFCRDRLGWDSVAVGKFTSVGGVAAVLSSMSCATAIRELGRRRVTLIAHMATVMRFLIYAGARSDAAMYAIHVTNFLGGITMRLSAMFSLHSETAIQDGLGGAEATAMRGAQPQ